MNILVADFVIVFMITIRLTAAFIAAPVLGETSIPSSLRITLALVISYIIFLTLNRTQNQFDINLYTLVLNAIKEFCTGLIIGYMVQFVFYAVNFAGALVGVDMQLSMAEVLNPMTEESSNVVGDLLYYSAILIFLLINGHHYIIRALAASFKIVPIGHFNMNEAMFKLLLQYSSEIFIIAVKIAAPILVSFFLVHVAEGIIARVIPQMQIFFVTQPLKLGLGLLFLTALVPVYVTLVKNLLRGFEDNLYNFIKAMA